MEIQFLQKLDGTGDFVKFLYNVEGKKIELEVGGTAMSVYNLINLSEQELGMIFIPIITDIYVKLNEQGAVLEKIVMVSEGIKNDGKIIYSKEEIEEVLKRKSRKLVMGEYWDIVKVESANGRPFKIFNSHQKPYELSGSHTPDLIDSFSTEREAMDFLYKK